MHPNHTEIMEKKVLSGMNLAEIQQMTVELGLPKFTAKQIVDWLYRKQIYSIDEMTNLSKEARRKLSEHYVLGRANYLKKVESADGTEKYLFPTAKGTVETVYIPTADRATLCISSQVGCKMGCKFCMTGKQGFEGQLTAAEIINQIYSIPHFEHLTNIVMMGQGEPFDNTEQVLRVCELMTASYGLAWSPKRITVSTVGLAPGLKRFLVESECNLAISLHFPLPELRAEWMPAEKAYPIQRLIDQLKEYDFCRNLRPGEARAGNHQRRLSFEYILFKNINDGEKHAKALIRMLKELDCRVNLIPYHTIPGAALQGVDEAKMKAFRDYLTRHGLFATLRASRGQDIEAACGLLNTAHQQKNNQQPS